VLRRHDGRHEGKIGLLIAVAAIVIAFVARGGGKFTVQRRDDTAARPVIAVLSLAMRAGDSTTAWLADGLPQMIDTKLANVPAVEVVPAAQVHAVLRRSGRLVTAPLRFGRARPRAARGATLVAHGSLARDGQLFVLDLSVHDVRTGALVRTPSSPMLIPDLADQAAPDPQRCERVVRRSRLMDIETSSPRPISTTCARSKAARPDADAMGARSTLHSARLGFIPALRSD
jgi:TolB-like protein